jgi:heme/copper-type cytochrome/quinol oxidase subunit 2
MTAERVAGWVAVVSGVLLLFGVAASAIGQAPGAASTSPNGYWPIGPGMMNNGRIGPGMMGFGNAGPAASAIPGATEVRVEVANFSFTPNEIRLPHGTDVNLTLSNPAANGVVHDLTVPGLGIHIVANPGETKTLGLRGLAAGRYDAFCSVPGHADLGMRATVIVE